MKNGLIKDLEELNFADEVFPIGERNIDKLKRDFNFWFVSSLGVVPLMIITLPDRSSQILALSLLFAFIWGVVFKKLVMQDSGGWLLPIGSLFFTGALGVFTLTVARALMPSFYWELHESTNSLVQLGGYIFGVGIREELCKVVPIFIYMAWERRKERFIDPLTLIVIGVFSGLGFAAFENMQYAGVCGKSANDKGCNDNHGCQISVPDFLSCIVVGHFRLFYSNRIILRKKKGCSVCCGVRSEFFAARFLRLVLRHTAHVGCLDRRFFVYAILFLHVQVPCFDFFWWKPISSGFGSSCFFLRSGE